MTVKNDGTNTSERTVETMRPPITAMAMGARISAPSPRPSAIGTMPMIIAIAVMMTGRMRATPASTAAL